MAHPPRRTCSCDVDGCLGSEMVADRLQPRGGGLRRVDTAAVIPGAGDHFGLPTRRVAAMVCAPRPGVGAVAAAK